MPAARIPVLAVATFLVALEAFATTGVLTDIATEFGTGVGTAGQVTSIFTMTAALAGVPLARALSGVPKRSLLVIAMVIQGIVNLVIAGAQSLEALLLLRILSGAAASLIPPNAAGAAAVLSSHTHRASALAWTTAGVVAAFLFGMPLATTVGVVVGWRGVFLLCGSIGFAGAFVIGLLLPDAGRGMRVPSGGVSAIWGPDLVGPLAITTTAFAAVFTVIGFAGPLVAATSGDVFPVGFVQVFLGVGALVGLPIAARLAARTGPRSVAVALATIGSGLAAQALALVFGSSGASVGFQLTAFVLLGSGLFGLSPAIQLSLLVAAPRSPEIALALNAIAVFVGQTLGTVIAGAGVALVGLGGAPLMGLVATAVAVTLIGRLPRSTDPESSAG